jgi:hypothetical protein
MMKNGLKKCRPRIGAIFWEYRPLFTMLQDKKGMITISMLLHVLGKHINDLKMLVIEIVSTMGTALYAAIMIVMLTESGFVWKD